VSGSPIRKILIANRGEIAVRIARACREMGIASVAVYSDADRAALHVLRCDEAYRLGPAPAAESYLRTDLILAIAQQCGADAIHPGYGFLSENAAFADACSDAGIIFIGPPAAAMRMLGSKTAARRTADKAGVPCVPGSRQGLESYAEAVTAANQAGYPVMLKAAAGGGGKGMRRVDSESDLKSALEAASSEAERAFGNGEVYIEKLILNPRHIEIQLIADQHGNCVYLGERECSVQRRHQKVIEEAPSSVVTPGLRARMGQAAVALAKSANYTNAGTIEFLVDRDLNFYFLEMNTRLQVEHPVTELVTGIDLVQLQIHVAEGRPLPFTQDQIQLRGHAIECRIYAEDPDNGFFPSPGKITRLATASGPGIREDSGVYEGWTIPLDYDPMLSKLIAYAPTRAAAIDRLRRALSEYFIGGVAANLSLFERILDDPAFRSADIDTGYLDRLLSEARLASPKPAAAAPAAALDLQLAAIAAAYFSERTAAPTTAAAAPDSPWRRHGRNEGLRS
jgi:acetyl-CoA carboxylase, biotin carboxylase subunit